ncbi:MAG: type II secretion system protein [Campylobacterales bacterium]|nr:type II secretion system protein [Campylobacterales bacterium]
MVGVARCRKAFTMVELVFVIVVIGILAAIAIPKLAVTRDDAVITKAINTVAAVRSAIATERSKNILMGNYDDFNKTSIGHTGTQVFTGLLEYPVAECTGSEKDCWVVGGTDSQPTYTFRGPTGDVIYTYKNKKFVCTSLEAVCKVYDDHHVD